MKGWMRILPVLMMGAACGGGRLSAASLDPMNLPPAEAIMQNVIAALPSTPLRVQAQLQSKSPSGRKEASLNAEMWLDWGARPPAARYTLRDAFGASLEALALVWKEAGEMDYMFYRGSPLTGAPLPNLYDSIQGTDISWIDLSLSFLWWPYGQTVGVEEIKGRSCYLIDVPSPLRETNTYARVRLWIDPQASVMLQAVAYDLSQAPVKRVEVKSFKKINKMWMIRDLEVQSFPSKHRTLLRVRNVEENGRPVLQKEDPKEEETGADEEGGLLREESSLELQEQGVICG